MRQLFFVTVFTFFLLPVLHAQDKIQYPQLKTTIDSLYAIDQQGQLDMIAAYQRGAGADSMQWYEARNHEVYARHIPLLKKIQLQYGYPDNNKVGAQSSNHFFTLVQHADADLAFQEMMLPVIKKQVKQKQVSGSQYAYLYDRVQINSGKPQLYGTQLTYTKDGNAVPRALLNKKGVNKRRKALGMQTLEIYLASATEIHQQMNQKN